MGSLPERYLVIPLVQGRVSKATVAPLIDRIRSRATGWSGKMLSFQSRVILIQSILTSLPIFNMAIYKWPMAAIKEGEIIIRNFLWSGDPAKKKLLTVKWDTSKVLKQRRSSHSIQKKSSIWTGLKEAIVSVKANSKWIIGSGKDIDFWRDYWGSDVAITEILDINPDIWKHCKAKLSQIIHQNTWAAPPEIVEFLATLGIDLKNITLNNSDKDIRVWKHCSHGNFSVQSAYHQISSHRPKVWWFKYINNKAILPRIASFTWKVCNNVLATEDNLRKRGLNMASRCSLCRCNLETSDHLFWHCPMSIQTWDWMASLFCIQAGFSNLQSSLEFCTQLSSYIADIWKAAVLKLIYFLWRARNDAFLEGITFSPNDIKRKICFAVKDAAGLSGNCMANNCLELQIVAAWESPQKPDLCPEFRAVLGLFPGFRK
ncbi:hypothetical protein GIB67_011334 [Kingdonia uniflora]|uniref:Reverse transcriptase zinc-binding domain-containing protein n=1 Tax=Kingdonia uniflora TaxID=39325 RepID=A0A7J7MNQ5_9MAGN|nr:hypothetical protein GIB67_011334 [Kingdonia uniflora]